jgi:hypothetical protein
MWVNVAQKHDQLFERGIEISRVLFQRLPDTICDYSRGVIDGKRDGALEAVGSRDEQTESAPERVGSYPCFVKDADVFAAGDNGRLDVFSAMPWNSLDVEDRERHRHNCKG